MNAKKLNQMQVDLARCTLKILVGAESPPTF